ENLDRALGLLGPAGRKPRGPMSEEERLRRRARVLVRAEMGRIEATVGNFERARGMLSGARREAAGLGDEEVMHGVLAVLGRVQEELGQVDEARATWEEITRGVKRSLASAVRLEAFMGLARIAVAQDRLDEAVVYVQAAEEAALEAGWMGVAMMGQVAEAWEVLGEPERSLGLIDRAVTIVRLSGVEDRARLPAMLQVKARLLCQVGPPQFQEAVRSAEEAVEISRQVGDPTSMAENMEGMAHILILAGEDSRAVEQFHAARHVYERLGHEAGAGRVHGHLARLHLQSGDADAARGHLDEALRLGAQVSTTAPEVLADALLTAASMEHEQGHAAETTAYLLAYLDLCLANSDVAAAVTALHGLDEQPPGHDLIRVSADQWRVLDHIIESAQSLEDVVECRLAGMKAAELRGEEAEYDRWLEEALHTARQCPPSRLDPAAMDDLARALEKRGNLADAANVYRALAARGDSDDLAGDVEEMRAYACGRAGELLTQAGQLSEGLQAYFEAERHAEKAASPIKDPGIAWNAFAIASIHLEEGRAEESKTWYKKAVQRWQALIDAGTGEIEERHNFISMLALAQVMSGEPGDALATMERFRARVEQQGRTHLQTWLVAACDLSEALIRQGNQDAAIYALNECLAYVGPETLPDIACRVHTMMSWMHAGKREIKKAFDATERALALVPDVADPSIALQAWVQLATLQSWMRDTDSAARTHLEVIRLSAELGDWKLLLEHRESLVLALAGAGALDEARVAWSQLQQARASAQEQLPDLRIPRAHFALAAIHLRTGDTGRARELILQDLVSASALEGPERVEEIAFLLSWLGTAYKQEGEWREAIAALNQCVEAVHGNPADGKERGFSDDSLASVYLELCEIHARLEQWDEAEESLAEAEKRAASDPWVERRLEGFREAVKNRTEPPSADPLQG
ncbi:MAG: tetratricopeptide repeat protein, partial [Armatimonadetes bacterium]|nr:tetratricopeptide repeat protein [Armatimonadota bacterium]